MRLGLALSGGGLRATLFHLGVVKALQRRGVLKDVKHITSVSGGSILAAHLVKNWESYLDESRFDAVAQEIIEFARIDVRGQIFRRLMLPHYYLLPYLENLRQTPRRLRRDGTVRNLLFERYLSRLLGDGTLGDLAEENPEAPTIDILTTNLTRGSLAYFSSTNFVPSDGDKATPVPTRTTVARAVMTSALFPAVFPTMELNAQNLMADSASLFPQPEYFTDGGVYDNLGIRRFQTVLRAKNCIVQNVLVCDASGAFDWLVGKETLGYWRTALRSTDILMKRLADLEYEIAAGAPNSFTFVRISDVVTPTSDSDLPEDVQKQIKNVRTDLDRFSTTEIDTIVQHGYSVASRALDHLCGGRDAEQSRWSAFHGRKQPPETQAIRLLQRASIHSKNLFRLNDWASYVYPVLFCILAGFAALSYDSKHFDRYYNTLSQDDRAITEHLHDPIVALKETKAGIGHSSSSPETRLRLAMLAYSLMISGQGPADVFDAALKQLGRPERTRFEEERWEYYFQALQKNTFGVPAVKDARAAVSHVNDAIPYMSPDLEVEAALTSYGAFILVRNDDASEALAMQSLDLMRRALAEFDNPAVEKRLTELNHFRARLLKGHYFLESGRLKTSSKDAEELYRKAADTYAEAGTISVLGEYWKVEYNRCNALSAAADAVVRYRDATNSARPAELKAVSKVIDTTRDQALEHCAKAQELAPATNWQPSFLIGSIRLKKQQPDLAIVSYLSGYAAARRAHEEVTYVTYLATEGKRILPLCDNDEFSQAFVRICRP